MAPTLPRDETVARNIRARMIELADTLPQALRSPVVTLVANPGKGLRSHLLEVCSRFGAADRRRVVHLGALIDLLHVATLLHDDVIDRAATRRGLPTAHVVTGHEPAVLAGTALLALVGQEAADLGRSVSQLFGVTTADLAHGELLDVERAFDLGFDADSYLEVARKKTSALFRLACVLGALEAHADEDTTVAVATFGSGLGIAFQIADDCLDLRANPGDKPAGTDHLLGLFGLPTLCALRTGDDALRELLVSSNLSTGDLPAIRARVRAAGGVDEAIAVADRTYQDAIGALGELTNHPAGAALVATGEAVRAQWT